MSGHTPGPWRTGKPREGCHKAFPHCVVFSSQGQVAYANWTPERDANAHLIAAAPDLLEALKRYVEHDDTAFDPAETFWRQIKDEALAAIAKAEGK